MGEFLFLEQRGPMFKVGFWSKGNGNFEIRVLNTEGALHYREDVADKTVARKKMSMFNNATGYFTNEDDD
jgi:hypothetical protein